MNEDDIKTEVNRLIVALGYDIDWFEADLEVASFEILDALEARLAIEDPDEDERTKMLSGGGICMVRRERIGRVAKALLEEGEIKINGYFARDVGAVLFAMGVAGSTKVAVSSEELASLIMKARE